MSREITREEAVALWAERKPVEAMGPERDGWGLIAPPGSVDGEWNASIFNREDRMFMFRIASIPVPHIRSWELGEVPIGALIKHDQWVNNGVTYAICGVEKDQVVWVTSTGPGKQTFHQLLGDPRWRHSVDGGKTWHPCGVKVTS